MRCFRVSALWLLLLAGAAAQGQDAKAYFGQGLEHLQQARFSLAAQQFEKAVAADPMLVIARYDLGVCYFADGRFPEARQAFQAVLRLAPDRKFARYYLARLDLLEDHLDSAIRALEPLASQGLGADEFYLLGTAYFKKGQTETAIARLKRAALLNSGDSRVHFQLARAYQKLGKTEEAAREYKLSTESRDQDQKRSRDLSACEASLASKHPDGVAHCRAMLDGDDTIRLTGLGALLAQNGKMDDAVAPLQRAARLDPDDYAPHFNLGLTYFNMRQYAAARSPLERAVALRPESFPAVALLGSSLVAMGEDLAAADRLRAAHRLQPSDPKVRALLLQEITVIAQETTKKGNYQRAAALSREALDLQPDSAEFHNLLGFCLMQQGDRKQALESFERAIAANPNFEPAHKNRAGLLVLDDRIAEAVAEFASVLSVDPNDNGVRRAVFDLAKQRFAKEDYSNSVELLRLAKPAMDSMAEWHELMGYSQYRLGDSAQAAAELQDAISMAPRNEDYVLELAEVFTAGNNAEAALALLRAALKVFPESARVWFAAGVAHLANSDLAHAEDALRRSLKIDPTLDLAYQVLGRGYQDAGMWDQLSATADALIRINPANHSGYFYRALVLMRAGSQPTNEVEALLRKSIALESSDPEPRYELSKLLLQEGKTAASTHELEALVKASPEFGQAYYRLYQLYKDRGDLQNSKEALEAYQQLRAQRGLPVRQLIVKVRQP